MWASRPLVLVGRWRPRDREGAEPGMEPRWPGFRPRWLRGASLPSLGPGFSICKMGLAEYLSETVPKARVCLAGPGSRWVLPWGCCGVWESSAPTSASCPAPEPLQGAVSSTHPLRAWRLVCREGGAGTGQEGRGPWARGGSHRHGARCRQASSPRGAGGPQALVGAVLKPLPWRRKQLT